MRTFSPESLRDIIKRCKKMNIWEYMNKLPVESGGMLRPDGQSWKSDLEKRGIEI